MYLKQILILVIVDVLKQILILTIVDVPILVVLLLIPVIAVVLIFVVVLLLHLSLLFIIPVDLDTRSSSLSLFSIPLCHRPRYCSRSRPSPCPHQSSLS